MEGTAAQQGILLGSRMDGTYELGRTLQLKHFLDEANWQGPVKSAIDDGGTPITVNVSGFEGGFQGMLTRGLSPKAGEPVIYTEREMVWLARAVANGRRDFPETLPDWSSFRNVLGEDW